MFHISDYFPTIIGLLGGSTSGLDGIDQWESLTSGTCQRSNLLHDITLSSDGSIETAFYRDGNYKLIIGDAGDNSGWYDTEQTDQELGDAYDATLQYLFDVSSDEREITNLRYDEDYADVVTSMTNSINNFVDSVYDFEIRGRCSTEDCIDANGAWYTGCCNV